MDSSNLQAAFEGEADERFRLNVSHIQWQVKHQLNGYSPLEINRYENKRQIIYSHTVSAIPPKVTVEEEIYYFRLNHNNEAEWVVKKIDGLPTSDNPPSLSTDALITRIVKKIKVN